MHPTSNAIDSNSASSWQFGRKGNLVGSSLSEQNLATVVGIVLMVGALILPRVPIPLEVAVMFPLALGLTTMLVAHFCFRSTTSARGVYLHILTASISIAYAFLVTNSLIAESKHFLAFKFASMCFSTSFVALNLSVYTLSQNSELKIAPKSAIIFFALAGMDSVLFLNDSLMVWIFEVICVVTFVPCFFCPTFVLRSRIVFPFSVFLFLVHLPDIILYHLTQYPC